jgi:gas vesicle protein
MKHLTSFLTGLAAGAVAGLVFAPKPGTETRRQIKGIADKTGFHVGQIVNDAKEAAKDAVGYSKDLAAKVKRHEKEAVVGMDHIQDGVESIRTA